jgi:hypothetical protein
MISPYGFIELRAEEGRALKAFLLNMVYGHQLCDCMMGKARRPGSGF